MDYYVMTGSVLLSSPRRQKVEAGNMIPADSWEELDSKVKAEFLRSGVVKGFSDPDSVQVEEPEAPALPKVGCGKDKFMEDATIQPGDRRDAALDALIKAQQEAEVDPDRGGSPDGVVQVELPPDDDDDDEGDEDLTPEEQAEIRRLEAQE